MRKTLITNEMIKLVKDSINTDELRKIEFNGPKSFYIGRCRITRNPGGQIYLNLEDGYDKEYGILWRADVGNILKNELKKQDPELYELMDSRFHALLKRISEDELEAFKENKFAHVKIGDTYYTVIRIIKPDGWYSNKDYKNDYYEDTDIENYIEEDTIEEIEEEEQKSLELF